MALLDLLKGQGLESYRQLQQLLDDIWGGSAITGVIPPLSERISLSITKAPRHGFVPRIHVDREDSLANRRAQEIIEQYPFVEAKFGGGEAQAAYPQDVKLQKHATSGKLRPGSAISHGRYPFGTLGCIVEAATDGIKYRFAVTAAHVVNLNSHVRIGDAIYCPGKMSVPRIKKADVFGVLENSVDLYPLNPDAREYDGDDVSTDIDIALVRIEDRHPRRLPIETRVPDPKNPDRETMKIAGVVTEESLGELLIEEVYLFGAVSGFSTGTLTDVGITEKVLRLPNRKNYLFKDLLGVAPKGKATFSQPGDSGSAIYTNDGHLIGFLIGADNNVSLACIGERALNEFNARII